jgi:hypothetical protein
MDNENLYDAPVEESPPPEQDGDEQTPSQGQGEPALLNREVWPDAQPGEVRTFRCLKVMDREIEVMAEDKEEGMEEEPRREPMMASGGGGESMMD